MKSLIAILMYITLFLLFYLLISVIGSLFYPYNEVISDVVWFTFYAVFVGWWLAAIPTYEVYNGKKLNF